jgi:hypothetical protein
MTGASRKPLLKNLCFLALFAATLVAGYVLSYAPLYRLQHGASRPPLSVLRVPEFRVEVGANRRLPGYAPVEWLMERTTLREPLFRWADAWGVGFDVRSGVLLRELFRQNRANRGDAQVFTSRPHGP